VLATDEKPPPPFVRHGVKSPNLYRRDENAIMLFHPH
jgi:hypothetical protein